MSYATRIHYAPRIREHGTCCGESLQMLETRGNLTEDADAVTCRACSKKLRAPESGAYQHRYLAYAAAHGRDPEAMLEHDIEEWPGGHMAGFILWISQQWQDWSQEQENKRSALTEQDHQDFDARLRRVFLEPQKSLEFAA